MKYVIIGIISLMLIIGSAFAIARSSKRHNTGNEGSAIVMAMISYGTENDGEWPLSLDSLKSDGLDPWFVDHVSHEFTYQRPVKDAKSTTVVLVEKDGNIIVYADGYVGNR